MEEKIEYFGEIIPKKKIKQTRNTSEIVRTTY